MALSQRHRRLSTTCLHPNNNNDHNSSSTLHMRVPNIRKRRSVCYVCVRKWRKCLTCAQLTFKDSNILASAADSDCSTAGRHPKRGGSPSVAVIASWWERPSHHLHVIHLDCWFSQQAESVMVEPTWGSTRRRIMEDIHAHMGSTKTALQCRRSSSSAWSACSLHWSYLCGYTMTLEDRSHAQPLWLVDRATWAAGAQQPWTAFLLRESTPNLNPLCAHTVVGRPALEDTTWRAS